MASDKLEHPGATGKLDRDQQHTLIIPASGTFDTRQTSNDFAFQPVPSNYKTITGAPVWRILLKFGSTGVRIVGCKQNLSVKEWTKSLKSGKAELLT